MKVTVNIECEAAEARAFLGLPDVTALNDHLVEFDPHGASTGRKVANNRSPIASNSLDLYSEAIRLTDDSEDSVLVHWIRLIGICPVA